MASILSAIAETLTAALMGFILDLLLDNDPSVLLSEKLFVLIIAVVFLLGARPLFFAVSAYIQSVILTPGIRTLIATRIHRWTLGHSKTFFENDFAGRVAQKEVQAANALTDVVVESIHTVLFALISVIAAIVIISIIFQCRPFIKRSLINFSLAQLLSYKQSSKITNARGSILVLLYVAISLFICFNAVF